MTLHDDVLECKEKVILAATPPAISVAATTVLCGMAVTDGAGESEYAGQPAGARAVQRERQAGKTSGKKGDFGC